MSDISYQKPSAYKSVNSSSVSSNSPEPYKNSHQLNSNNQNQTNDGVISTLSKNIKNLFVSQ